MRKMMAASVAVMILAAFAGPVSVAGEKEVTLEGTIVCAKCSLHEADGCQNVLVVEKKKGKQKHYYLTKNDAYEEIGEVCSSTTSVRVTGNVTKEDGQLWLTAKEIEPVEAKG